MNNRFNRINTYNQIYYIFLRNHLTINVLFVFFISLSIYMFTLNINNSLQNIIIPFEYLYFNLLAYHLFFVIIIPLIFRIDIYYNDTIRSVSFKQQKILEKYERSIFVSDAFYNDIGVVNKKTKYTKLVPFVYFNFLDKYIQKNQLNFFARISIYFFVIFGADYFFIMEYIVKYNTQYWHHNNITFVYVGSLIVLYLWFIVKMVFSSKIYYENELTAQALKKYFLIDYKLPEGGLKQVSNEKIYEVFLTVYISIVLTIFIPIFYNEIYETNVNINSIDKKVLRYIDKETP